MKSSITRLLPILLAIVFAVSFSTSSAQEVSKTFSGVKKIKLSTSAGDCILKKGTGNDVQVNLSFTYPSDAFRPEMEMEGNTLVLKEDFNKRSVSGKSTWTLSVPENLEVSFNTGSGNLSVSNLAINVNSNSGSGDLDAENTNGKFKFNTGSGQAMLSGSKGDVEVNSGSGNITVSTSEGSLSLNTGSGDIKLTNLKAALSANTGSGDVSANQITLTSVSTFNTGSGDVEVRLSTSPLYNMSLNSGSGDAVLSYNGNKMEGTIIMTANKENGEIKAPFNFDKSEEINEKGDQIRIRKTAKLSDKDITIKIGTGSGKAVVEK